jgi:hypothetical protein
MPDPKDELFGDGGASPKPETATDKARPILTDEEIARAREIARERVSKALKEAETERLIAEEMQRIKAEEGKRTGQVDLDETVEVTVDLAEFAAKLTINGQDYWHGYTYTVPRHVFDSMRDIMFRGHLHQNALDGKDLATFYRSKQSPVLAGSDRAAA